ncbi:tetratricopeptide repeat protein [Streptomyces sp. NPDC096193]|uniref:tetratricopeptide repeat protein n=1 Tax=Streptomyces sp. NPDC096193 TaxID=3155821 RepID=UPI003320EB0C
MRSEHLKTAAISTLVAATLVTGVVVLVPGRDELSPRPAPGSPGSPGSRGPAATATGIPAALDDLTALIAERERRLQVHPRDGESWALLGSAYVQRGTRLADWAAFPKAENALRRSLEVMPAEEGNTEALVGLATLAVARQDFVTARVLAERAVKQRPKQWTAYPALIEACNGLGDYKAAIKAMDTLTSLHTGPQALGLAAGVYRNRGWREDAAAAAYDAVGSASNRAEKAVALQQLGDLAWERGEPQEAVEAYDRALRLAPDHHPALASRARALAALGRNDDAFRDYQAALEELPLPQYALEAGELYESLGLSGDAQSQYELMRTSAAKAGENGVNEELVLGQYEADHGDPEAAVRRLRSEWNRKHRSIQVADALGWALFKAGRAKEALPYARRATDAGLRSPQFAYHRGEIERELGLSGPARRHLAEALRINPHFSPLLAPLATDALAALGELPDGGPRKVTGEERDTESVQGDGAAGGGTVKPKPEPSERPRSGDAGPSGDGAGYGPGAGTGSSGTDASGAGSTGTDASGEGASATGSSGTYSGGTGQGTNRGDAGAGQQAPPSRQSSGQSAGSAPRQNSHAQPPASGASGNARPGRD